MNASENEQRTAASGPRYVRRFVRLVSAWAWESERKCYEAKMGLDQALVSETIEWKLKHERWMRLASDMLAPYLKEDFYINDERLEAWRQEWSDIAGMNYHEYH